MGNEAFIVHLQSANAQEQPTVTLLLRLGFEQIADGRDTPAEQRFVREDARREPCNARDMSSQATTSAVVVGGEPDECDVTLAFYGVTLDPDVLNHELGCTPTHAHRAGEPNPSGIAFATGAWILTSHRHRGSFDDAIHRLLDRIAIDDERWHELAAHYDVRLSVALFTSRWGCGYELSPSTLARVHRTGAQLGVTFYADVDAPEEGTGLPGSGR